MMDIRQTTYSESRTAKGDKWFQDIKELKNAADALSRYAEAMRAFDRMIEDGLSTLPLDDSREIARAELQEYCSKRTAAAQQAIASKLKQVQVLESKGVDG